MNEWPKNPRKTNNVSHNFGWQFDTQDTFYIRGLSSGLSLMIIKANIYFDNYGLYLGDAVMFEGVILYFIYYSTY